MQAVFEFNEFLIAHMLEENPMAIEACDVYTIPVVVHVIHTGQSEGVSPNISDAQIQSAIDDLNEQFRNESELSVDICVQFCLAQRDPEGNTTDGIVRINGYNVCESGACYQDVGIVIGGNEETIKNLSRWPNKDYYNIWIVSEINGNNGGDGVQGFSSLPGFPETKDGVVVMYNTFGTSGDLKSYTNLNKTIVHETGHFFSVLHTFEGDDGGTSCPPNTNCTMDGDHLCDTPPHIRSPYNCDENGTNSCDSNSPNEKFVHNYMDYSDQDCRYMFTDDQRTKIRCSLMAVRSSLTYSLGCFPACTTVVASYTGGNPFLDIGDNVTYTNTSTNGLTYVWRLNGIVISTSTNLNHTFTEGGIFELCLDATGEHCINRYCTSITVVPICIPPQNECERVVNGNFEQIDASETSDPNDFSIVCGWEDTNSSPFFCAQPENNAIGFYFRRTATHTDYERLTSELPLDLVEGKRCELSFDYYVAKAPMESIIIALTEDATTGLLPIDATIIAQIDDPSYDPYLAVNNQCYPEEAAFQHYFDEEFEYNGDGNLYLNVTGTTDIANTKNTILFVDNLSISCCLPDCEPEPDFTFVIDSCDVTFYGVNTGDEGEYKWDFGDGSIGTGEEVSHTFLWPGIYNVCLIIECDEFGAAIICKEVEIPEYCDFCTQLPPVISRQCDEEDSTYVAQFSFIIPNGYAPCGSGLFVTSDEVQVAVNSFSLDSFNLTSSIVTTSLHLIPPYGFDFEVDSAFLYITFCDTSGHMICYTVAVIGATCDFCTEIEEPVIAECNEELSTQSLFVYEGTFVFDVGVTSVFIEAIAPSVGFEILSSSHISTTEWSFDFSIATTDLDFSNISVLFVFYDPLHSKYFCFTIPFVIDTTCPTIPVECKSNWQKTILCSQLDDNGLVVFPTGLMSIPIPEGFDFCQGGPIVLTDDPYELVVNSVNIIDDYLWFDIEIHADRDSFGRQAFVRFIFCNERGDTMVCQGVWFKLKCDLILPRSYNYNGKPIKTPESICAVMPNPVSETLQVLFKDHKKDIFNIELVDLFGRSVFSEKIPPEDHQLFIDVSGVTKGIYFLVVLSSGKVLETNKIVVVR
jgi:hypothetical protein